MRVYGKYECFVMKMLYVCVLYASFGTSQCCIWHDLQFEDARGNHMEEEYSRADLMTALYISMSVSFFLPILLLSVLLSFVVDCVLVLRCCEYVCCM